MTGQDGPSRKARFQDDLPKLAAAAAAGAEQARPAAGAQPGVRTREIPLYTIIVAFRRAVERERAMRQLPAYLLLMAAITSVPWMSRLSNERYNELYHLELATATELHLDQFKAVQNRDDFWDWLHLASKRIWSDWALANSTWARNDSGPQQHSHAPRGKQPRRDAAGSDPAGNTDPGNSAANASFTPSSGPPSPRRGPAERHNAARIMSTNLPIGVVLLRQYRVAREPCVFPSVVTPEFRRMMPSGCAGEWEDARASMEPFGPNSSFIPASMMEDNVDVIAVSTAFHDYEGRSGMAFPEILPVLSPGEKILKRLEYLRLHSWVDQATRLVIVDICTYNPNVNAFALNHAFVEFFATGSAISGVKAYPFDILHGRGVGQALLYVIDLFVCGGMVLIVVFFLLAVWLRRALRYEVWLGLWDIFDGLFVVVLVIQSYFRLAVWSEGPELDHGVDPELDPILVFEKLFRYGYHYERANTFVGLSVVFAWLRLFRYLQYSARLGVLSQTIAYAKNDILSMIVIFALVLIGYGIGGSALYGVDSDEFSTWYVAMSYLMRLVISAEVNQDYDHLTETHPQTTGWYISTFMIITWMILLNMVLAIITGAFVTVQQSVSHAQDPFSVRAMTGQFANVVGSMRRNGCLAFCRSDKRLRTLQLLFVLGELREEEEGIEMKEQFLCLEDFTAAVAGVYDEAEARHHFRKAQGAAGVKGASEFKVSERFAGQVNAALGTMQDQLRNLNTRFGRLSRGKAAVSFDCDDSDPGTPKSPLSPAVGAKEGTQSLKQLRQSLKLRLLAPESGELSPAGSPGCSPAESPRAQPPPLEAADPPPLALPSAHAPAPPRTGGPPPPQAQCQQQQQHLSWPPPAPPAAPPAAPPPAPPPAPSRDGSSSRRGQPSAARERSGLIPRGSWFSGQRSPPSSPSAARGERSVKSRSLHLTTGSVRTGLAAQQGPLRPPSRTPSVSEAPDPASAHPSVNRRADSASPASPAMWLSRSRGPRSPPAACTGDPAPGTEAPGELLWLSRRGDSAPPASPPAPPPRDPARRPLDADSPHRRTATQTHRRAPSLARSASGRTSVDYLPLPDLDESLAEGSGFSPSVPPVGRGAQLSGSIHNQGRVQDVQWTIPRGEGSGEDADDAPSALAEQSSSRRRMRRLASSSTQSRRPQRSTHAERKLSD